jgi:purine nucleosidase
MCATRLRGFSREESAISGSSEARYRDASPLNRFEVGDPGAGRPSPDTGPLKTSEFAVPSRRLVIDSDTGSDDAVAIVLALADPSVHVEAITIVAGNVPLEQGVQNALYTLELCGADVPAYRGVARPLLRAPATAQQVHGEDGMGDIGLVLKGRTPRAGAAVDELRRIVRRRPGEIELVTLGPLTNIALAGSIEPEFARAVKRCVVMGGIGSGRGNITPVAEYNIWADPDAARIVFESGMTIEMVGWDISRTYATFDAQQAAALRAIGTPVAEFCIDIQRALVEFALKVTGLPGFDLPDPIAMAVALEPEIVSDAQPFFVAVDTAEGLSRGQTIVDVRNAYGRAPNVAVVNAVSRERFVSMLEAAMRAFPHAGSRRPKKPAGPI